MLYYEYYILGIILLPALILAIYAQAKVSSAYTKYDEMPTKGNLTGAQVARAILDTAGYREISVKENTSGGDLSDHYDPTTKTVNLSTKVYNQSTISSLGVASHEVGHAIQDMTNYFPMKLRTLVIKISNISSRFLWPIIIIGLIFDLGMVSPLAGRILLWSGVIFFGLSTLLNFITLSVEYDASNRALKILKDSRFLDDEELYGAKKVLSAAALTYLASLLISVLQLVRFLLIVLSNTRRE